MTHSVTDRSVHVFIGPPAPTELGDGVDEEVQGVAPRRESNGARATATSASRTGQRNLQAYLGAPEDGFDDDLASDGENSGSDADSFGSNVDGAGRGRRRARRDQDETSPRTAVLSIGSRHVSRKITIKKEKTAKKIDKCFAEMKKIVFQQLVKKGNVNRGDRQAFKMQFDHNRSIVRWWVADRPTAQMKKGVYDYNNDANSTDGASISHGDKDRLNELSYDIVSATDHLTGVGVDRIQTLSANCLGPIGSTNLTRHFTAADAAKFAGGLHNKTGSEASKREKAFAEFMDREFNFSRGKKGARSAEEVSKDSATALVYQKAMVDYLAIKEKILKTQVESKLAANGGQESEEIKLLRKDQKAIMKLAKRFGDMHMNPYFVSKTYEADTTEADIFKRANVLKKSVHEHYAAVGKARRGKGSMILNSIRRSKYEEPKGYKQLALRIASKETFKRREDYHQYCLVNGEHNNQSLGLEEIFFDNMVVLDVNSAARVPVDFSLGMFDKLADSIQTEVYQILGAARTKVQAMRLEIEDAVTEGMQDKDVINAAKQALHKALEEKKTERDQPDAPVEAVVAE